MKQSVLSSLGQRLAAPPISWLMKLSLDRPNLISLAAGFTDNPSLPVHEALAIADEILGAAKSGQAALQYGTTAGDAELLELTARRVRELDARSSQRLNRGLYSTSRLLLTHGSQQLLYLVAECLCDEGDIVLVEDPTYFVFLGILQARGLRAHGVRLQSDGLDLEHLEEVLDGLKKRGELPRLKMLYLVSYFHNPATVTTRFEKKTALLQLLRRYEGAAGHPIYVLEDAAYRELPFASNREHIPSALAAKYGERVIYAGTYSKPFATGIRVGFGFLPEPLYTAALRAKGNHDFGTSNLLQRVLVRALKKGDYARHLAVLHRRYETKAAVMACAMEQHFPAAVQWAKPEGGLYIWAGLPRSVSAGPESKVFKSALAHDVLYVPGELCYADDAARAKPNHEMRLSFGGASENGIRDGIGRLGIVLRRLK